MFVALPSVTVRVGVGDGDEEAADGILCVFVGLHHIGEISRSGRSGAPGVGITPLVLLLFV